MNSMVGRFVWCLWCFDDMFGESGIVCFNVCVLDIFWYLLLGGLLIGFVLFLVVKFVCCWRYKVWWSERCVVFVGLLGKFGFWLEFYFLGIIVVGRLRW